MANGPGTQGTFSRTSQSFPHQEAKMPFSLSVTQYAADKLLKCVLVMLVWSLSETCTLKRTLMLSTWMYDLCSKSRWSEWTLTTLYARISQEWCLLSSIPSPPPQVIKHRCDRLPRGCWLVRSDWISYFYSFWFGLWLSKKHIFNTDNSDLV